MAEGGRAAETERSAAAAAVEHKVTAETAAVREAAKHSAAAVRERAETPTVALVGLDEQERAEATSRRRGLRH